MEKPFYLGGFKQKIDLSLIRAFIFIQDNESICLTIMSTIVILIAIFENLFFKESTSWMIPIFSILWVFGIFSSILQYKNESDRKQNQLNNLKSYTQELEKLYSDMREFRHDYVNILSTMSAYIKNKEYNQLEKYFNEKIVPIGQEMDFNNYKIGTLKNISIQEIKSIVAMKTIMAQERGIDFSLEIIDKIDEINIDIVEMSRIIGIILDNAIEASMMCESPYIHLAFVKNKNTITIIAANSCAYNTPPVHQIYHPDFSTKGKGRGLGLNNLKKILDKYPSSFLETTITDNRFMVTIKI